MRKIILLSFFIGCVTFYSSAQEYADKEFYLINSLELEKVDKFNRNILDSILTIYHDTDDDTLQLMYINSIVDNCWDDKVWIAYNKYQYENTKAKIPNINNPKVKRSYKYFNALALGNFGYIYDVSLESDSALVYYNKGLEILLEIGDKYFASQLYNAIATIYTGKGNVILALENFNEALVIGEELKDPMLIGTILRNIAYIQKEDIDYEKAFNSLEKAFNSLGENEQDKILKGILLITKADIYTYKNELKLAASSAQEGKDLLGLNNDTYQTNRANHIILDYYFSIDSLEKAKVLSQEMIQIAISNNQKEFESLGLYFYSKYNYRTKNYIDSKNQIEKSLRISNEINEIDRIIHSSFLAIKIYEALGLKDEQIEALKLHYETKDEYEYNRTKKESVKIGLQYEYDKQKVIDDLAHKQEIELKEAQKQKTKLGLLAAVLISLIIALAAYLIYSRLRIIEEQKVKLDDAYEQLEESKKNELAVSNLKALQSQMNPHFIFNALNSVQDLVLLKDIRSSNKFLGKFSDLIRKILLSSKQQFISLEEEVEILGLYLDLEGLRFGKEFNIDFTCEVPKEKQEEIQLPAMFIQPYIENAIKHGLFNKKGEKHLKVAFKMINKSTLECIVQDNGVGQKQAALMKEQRLHLHTGFSTEAINERIQLLNQTLDKKIELEIIDLEENGKALGTKIILHFPV